MTWTAIRPWKIVLVFINLFIKPSATAQKWCSNEVEIEGSFFSSRGHVVFAAENIKKIVSFNQLQILKIFRNWLKTKSIETKLVVNFELVSKILYFFCVFFSVVFFKLSFIFCLSYINRSMISRVNEVKSCFFMLPLLRIRINFILQKMVLQRKEWFESEDQLYLINHFANF